MDHQPEYMSDERLKAILSYFGNKINFLQQLIRELSDKINNLSSQSSSDHLKGTGSAFYDFHRTPSFPIHLHFGTITHAIPHCQNYEVKIDGPNIYITAAPLYSGSSYPGGAAYYTYAPGTRVIVAISSAFNFGIILGTVPLIMSEEAGFVKSMAAPGCGMPYDCQYYYKKAYTDWCGRTPYDSTSLNECGYAAETGMNFHVDPFFAQLKLNSVTGVFLSYWDNLLRLAGRYTQEWKGGVTRDYYFDNECANNVGGVVMYFRELKGCLVDDAEPIEYLSGDEVADKPWLTTYEPKSEGDKELAPFHRVIDYSGFLGNGLKRYVAIYPHEHDELFQLPLTQFKHPRGVAEYGVLFDGSLGFRSASGIYISKYPIIIPPILQKNPADPGIQHEAFNGENGGQRQIKDFELRLGNRAPGNGIQGFYFPMSIVDQSLAHFLYYSTRGIDCFKEDFAHPKDEEYDAGPDLGRPIPLAYPDVCSDGRVSAIPYKSEAPVEIDGDRWKKNFYASGSYVACLPDGSIGISDGYGGEIRLGGGKIFISAPYGLYLQSGREIVSFAGGDIVQTANGAVEITAKGRAALVSYSDLWLAGGLEGGDGRVYVESRSKNADAGIFISAPFSAMKASAANVNIKAFGGSGYSTSQPGYGTIVLEATDKKGNPSGLIGQYGSFVVHDVGCAVIHRCGAKDPPSMAHTKKGVDGVYVFSSLAARHGAPLFVTDSIGAKGPIKSLQEIEQAVDTRKVISCFEFIQNVFEWSNKVCEESKTLSKDIYDRRVNLNWRKPHFKFSSIFDYKTTLWEYPESRWERDCRIAETGLANWDPRFPLPDYDDEGAELESKTYSYPGRLPELEVGDTEATNSDYVVGPKQVLVNYSFFVPAGGMSKVPDTIGVQFWRTFNFKLGVINQ